MKKSISLIAYSLTLLGLTLLSCEVENETEVIEENLMLSSDSGDIAFEKESENVKIVLHMNFADDVTEEEAHEQFNEATEAYLQKQQQNKSAATKFRYRVMTETNDKKYHGTDGRVHSKVRFMTSNGIHTFIKHLDNPNKNDFERGNTDYFLLEVTPDTPVCWVSILPSGTSISLKGTDGWGIKKYHVNTTAQMQLRSANGSSYLYSYPNTILDSPSSSQWDTYNVPSNYNGFIGNLGFNCNDNSGCLDCYTSGQ